MITVLKILKNIGSIIFAKNYSSAVERMLRTFQDN